MINKIDKQYGDCYQAYLKRYKVDNKPGIVYYTDPLQYKPYTQEEFINKIKTDNEFAKEWGELGKHHYQTKL